MKNVVTRNKIKDPYCKRLAFYLAKEINKPKLIEVFYSTLVVTKYFDKSACYCIGLVLPFYITLPLYIFSYLEENRVIKEARDRSIIQESDVIKTNLTQWFNYYQYINEVQISNKYNYIINNPSLEELENYQKILQIPQEALLSTNYLNQINNLFGSTNLNIDFKEEILTTIRNNDQIRAIYYLLTYLGSSPESTEEILKYSKLCLTLQLNRQASLL